MFSSGAWPRVPSRTMRAENYEASEGDEETPRQPSGSSPKRHISMRPSAEKPRASIDGCPTAWRRDAGREEVCFSFFGGVEHESRAWRRSE